MTPERLQTLREQANVYSKLGVYGADRKWAAMLREALDEIERLQDECKQIGRERDMEKCKLFIVEKGIRQAIEEGRAKLEAIRAARQPENCPHVA